MILRLYLALLFLYPPSFRREYGAELARCARDMRDRSSNGALGRRLAADLAASLPREWAHVLARGAARPVQPRPPAGEPMQNQFRDLRYAVRLLMKSPGFTAAAAATLALAIGANTAMFSLADATLLRPLPVSDPGRLVALPWSSSYPDFLDYQEHAPAFSGLMATAGGRVNVSVDGATELRPASFVSGNAFGLLGASAAIGRILLPDDDRGPGGPIVAVLSHEYWMSRFGGADVVGRAIRANERAVTIVGVAERGFRGTSLFSRPDVYLPLTASPQVQTGFMSRIDVLGHRGFVWLNVIGRMKPGVALAEASASIETVYRRAHPPAPGEKAESLQVMPLRTRALGGRNADTVRQFVFLLIGVVGATLLIGCANLANMLLARAARRRHEIGVRLALGATRWRIAQQMLIESVLLAAVGGALGLCVARVALQVLGAYQLPGGIAIDGLALTINGRALLLTGALTIVTGLLFGSAPAWRAAGAGVLPSLRDDGQRGTPRSRLRSTLIVAQVALTLILLAGSGLFLRSLVHGLNAPLGFDPAGVAAVSVNPGLARYDDAQAAAYYDAAIERVRALPGVRSAAWTTVVPLKGSMMGHAEVDGYRPMRGEDMTARFAQVTPGYFETLHTRIVDGRTFDGGDRRSAELVVVVNRTAAERYWPGRSAVGGRLRMSEKTGWFTVIGVAEDARLEELDEKPNPALYFVFGQPLGTAFASLSTASLLARTDDVTIVLPLVAEAIRGADLRVPVYDAQPFAGYVLALLMPQRMGVTLLVFFSVLAVCLATIGIYGVGAYVAAMRTREIGIRLALGADRRQINRLLLADGLAPVVIGLSAGLLLALWSARLASQFLYGVKPYDPLTFAAVASIVAVLSLVATYLPSRRAARMDPAATLRQG